MNRHELISFLELVGFKSFNRPAHREGEVNVENTYTIYFTTNREDIIEIVKEKCNDVQFEHYGKINPDRVNLLAVRFPKNDS